MVHKDKDLLKHGRNLHGYLQHGGKSNSLNFGVLDWKLLENWKSNTKRVIKTSLSGNNLAPESRSARLSFDGNGKEAERTITSEMETSFPDGRKHMSQHEDDKSALENYLTIGEDFMKFDPDTERHSSLSRRFSINFEKITKSFSFKSGTINGSLSDLHNFNSKKANIRRFLDLLLKHKERNSGQKAHKSNRNLISSSIDHPYNTKRQSSSLQALIWLTMKNGIPFFKLTVVGSSHILAATLTKSPSGEDDSTLIYTFYSMHEITKNGYKIIGHMKISSSYHAEFIGLERDLFVVRESVVYGPDFEQLGQISSDCMLKMEVAAIIVKNTSKESYGGLGSSKSAVVVLPGGNHSLPNSGKVSPLIDRWRSGGDCDCGGWDVGCELGVLVNRNETVENSDSFSSDRLDLCYQGKSMNKHALSLIPLENELYSLEYNSSISSLQAFSICVAVISSQNLTHIFQVNHLQEDANDFTKPIIRTRHRKVKSQTIIHAKIPIDSPIGRV